MMMGPETQGRLDGLLRSGERRILGIAGLPGAGKSTLSARIRASLGDRCVIVPMDGFHLANAELQRLGRRERKGAPDTFDVAGFVALLVRLRQPVVGETVYAPAFHREIEEAIAGEIAVAHDVPLVVVEGNYLLLDQGPWRSVRACLDEAWFVDVDDARRRAQLLDRHIRFGRSRAAALAWIEATDEPNARLVATTAGSADHRVALAPDALAQAPSPTPVATGDTHASH
jgi:pantothenate kinase